MPNVGSVLLDCADILRSTSALVLEEETYVYPDKRSEFERQVAIRVNEITECLRDLMNNLGGDVRVYSNRNWAESKKRWSPLRSESERITRQVALLKLPDQKESLATFGWMANHGRVEELQVLQEIRKSPSAVDEDIAKLMDIAEQQMRQRVYGSSYKDEGNLEPEAQNEEEQDLSGLELLLRAYRPWLDSDRRHILNQVIPEIRRACIRERDCWEPRGSLSEPAAHRLPSSLSDDVKHLLLDALGDQRPAVRQEVAGALGEWGDETAVVPLAQMLVGPDQDPSDSVRRACAGALGLIGGPLVVKPLIAAAERDPAEMVRRDAIYALSELILAEAPVPPKVMEEPFGSPVLSQTQLLASGPEARAIMKAMQRISSSSRESEFLRHRAETVANLLAVAT